jgi:predicted dehydrogenase
VGIGARFNLLDAAYYKQDDASVAAICDINPNRLDAYRTKYQEKKFQVFKDYRQMFESKDIDAVVICTPDHQHAPAMIAAIQAGKDVYVDKPASNTVEAAVAMLKAYRSHDRVVQLGTQQRSWDHFRAAAKLIWDGYIGDVTHVIVAHNAGYPSGGGRGRQVFPAEKLEGLDWNAFLGPAKKVPYDPLRYANWRAYWDYGGGMVTDWGVHWIDIVHLCMKSDYEGPSYTSSVCVPNSDAELVSTDWFINYKYSKYLMSFIGIAPSTTEPVVEGPTFYGTKGWLRVNRNGYIVRANRTPVRLAFTAAGQAAARAAEGKSDSPGPGGPPTGALAEPGEAWRRAAQTPPINDITEVDPVKNVPGERGSEVAHVRNFLDCVKSRQKPVAEFEIGFHSTLSCLLGLLSIQQQRAIVWDEKTLIARFA